jgi:hypothetical protein
VRLYHTLIRDSRATRTMFGPVVEPRNLSVPVSGGVSF